MLKRTIKQIHKLRLQFLALIVIIFFFELGMNPLELGEFIGAKFSSAITTMSVGVAENPYNKVAMQLKLKEKQLTLKEKELAIREAELKEKKMFSDSFLLSFVSVGIVILFILILLNFYFDHKRKLAKSEIDKKKIFK